MALADRISSNLYKYGYVNDLQKAAKELIEDFAEPEAEDLA